MTLSDSGVADPERLTAHRTGPSADTALTFGPCPVGRTTGVLYAEDSGATVRLHHGQVACHLAQGQQQGHTSGPVTDRIDFHLRAALQGRSSGPSGFSYQTHQDHRASLPPVDEVVNALQLETGKNLAQM